VKHSRKDIETLKGLLESHCGLCFAEKENILLRQTTERMQAVKIAALDEYLFYLFERGDDELHQLVNLLTINETYFYRHADQIALLQECAEEMVRREPYGKSQARLFRVWSAGCSIGAEPYTIAIALQDLIHRTGANFKIIATDIDSEVLAKAESGVYSKRQVTAEMPPDLLERHFTPHRRACLSNDSFRISDELKKMVTFKKHNLKTDIYPEGMDIIFCRNVLIYFNSRTRNGIIQRLHAALRHGHTHVGQARLGPSQTDGGLLFLSPVESVPEFRVYFTEILGKDGVKCYQKWTTCRRSAEHTSVDETPEQSDKRRPLEVNPYPSVERTHACGTGAPGTHACGTGARVQNDKIAISGIIDGSERIEMFNKELLLALGAAVADAGVPGRHRFSQAEAVTAVTAPVRLDLTNLLYISNEGLFALWQALSESRKRGVRIDCVEVANEGMQRILERAGFRTFGQITITNPKSQIPTPKSQRSPFETRKVTQAEPQAEPVRETLSHPVGTDAPGESSRTGSKRAAHYQASLRLVVTEAVVEEEMSRRYEDKFFDLLRKVESSDGKSQAESQAEPVRIIIDLKSCRYVDKSFFVALKRFHTACGAHADVTIECPDYMELWLQKYQIPVATVRGKPVPGAPVAVGAQARAVMQACLCAVTALAGVGGA